MVVILVAPSCAGKTTIEDKLIKLGVVDRLKVFTDRVKRPNETDEYVFVSKDKFPVCHLNFSIDLEHIGRYMYPVYKRYNVEHKMTSFITYKHAKAFSKHMELRGIDNVILGIDYGDDILECLKNRGYSEKEIRVRLANFKKLPSCIKTVKRDEAIKHITELLSEPQGV